jgi:hypothetical protein
MKDEGDCRILARMRIAFIDATGWDFNVETPFRRPLGGSNITAGTTRSAKAPRTFAR